MVYQLGVDVGTTFTATAVQQGPTAHILPLSDDTFAAPSLVGIHPDGPILVGSQASSLLDYDTNLVARAFKRRMGDPTPIVAGGVPRDASWFMARVLAWVVETATTQMGHAPETVAVTHPANWHSHKITRMRQAVAGAGLDAASTLLLTEPEAAAMAFAEVSEVADGETVVVYDLGGGTFDTAVLRREEGSFKILGSPQGMERLGGLDFDAAVYRYITDQLGPPFKSLDPTEPGVARDLNVLRQACTLAKEALSFEIQTAIPISVGPIEQTVTITRSSFEALIHPALMESIGAVRRVLRTADIEADTVSRVLLAGGSSHIPLVSEVISTEMKRHVSVDGDPKQMVAIGAAHAAALAAGRPRVEVEADLGPDFDQLTRLEPTSNPGLIESDLVSETQGCENGAAPKQDPVALRPADPTPARGNGRAVPATRRPPTVIDDLQGSVEVVGKGDPLDGEDKPVEDRQPPPRPTPPERANGAKHHDDTSIQASDDGTATAETTPDSTEMPVTVVADEPANETVQIPNPDWPSPEPRDPEHTEPQPRDPEQTEPQQTETNADADRHADAITSGETNEQPNQSHDLSPRMPDAPPEQGTADPSPTLAPAEATRLNPPQASSPQGSYEPTGEHVLGPALEPTKPDGRDHRRLTYVAIAAMLLVLAVGAAVVIRGILNNDQPQEAGSPAPDPTQEAGSWPSTVTLAIESSPGVNLDQLIVVRILEDELGINIDIRPAIDSEQLGIDLANGAATLGIVDPLSYAALTTNNPADTDSADDGDSGVDAADSMLLPAAVQTNDPQDTGFERTYGLTTIDNTNVEGLEDFAPGIVCFADRQSLNGYQIPASGLEAVNIDTTSSASPVSVLIAGSHASTIGFVDDGTCPVGFVSSDAVNGQLLSGELLGLADATGEVVASNPAEATIKVVWQSPKIMNSPVVMSSALPQSLQDAIVDTLINKVNREWAAANGYCGSGSATCVITSTGAWGFAPATFEDFDGLRQLCATPSLDACKR